MLLALPVCAARLCHEVHGRGSGFTFAHRHPHDCSLLLTANLTMPCPCRLQAYLGEGMGPLEWITKFKIPHPGRVIGQVRFLCPLRPRMHCSQAATSRVCGPC